MLSLLVVPTCCPYLLSLLVVPTCCPYLLSLLLLSNTTRDNTTRDNTTREPDVHFFIKHGVAKELVLKVNELANLNP